MDIHFHVSCGSNPLVVIVNSYRKGFLRRILANYVFIKKGFDLLGLEKVDIPQIHLIIFIHFLFQNLCTKVNALIADKYIVVSCNQLFYLFLRFSAKRTSDSVLRSVRHIGTPLSFPSVFQSPGQSNHTSWPPRQSCSCPALCRGRLPRRADRCWQPESHLIFFWSAGFFQLQSESL